MPSESSSTAPLLSQALPGTWRLVTRIDRTLDGELREEPSLGSDPVALLFYDRAGHFSAQFMKRDRSSTNAEPGSSSPPANNTRAQGGYDAYFGSYSVDDANGTVTQTLDGALSPENVGLIVTREMLVSGNALTIALQTTSGAQQVIRTLVWERIG